MKPIKLKIEGLQSFEQEQVIDFEKLTEHGLFGIFGPTGSGKSTILDAITLAIYGDIVRIRGNQADKLEHLVNINSNGLKIDFIFKLGEDKYQIIREMKFKKNERVFSGSKKVLLLKNEDIIADKDGQIKSEIENIIGLSMDDFTRSVVLPQGKFSEFLKLSGTDRRDMLERLFGLQKYGKQLMDKIRRKSNEHQSKITAIDNQILGKGPFKEEELKESEENLLVLNQKKIEIEKTLKEKNENYKFQETVWKLQEELRGLEATEISLKKKESEIEELKNRIEINRKAAETYVYYEKSLELDKKTKEKDYLFKSLESELASLESKLIKEKESLEEIKLKIQVLEEEKELKKLESSLRKKAENVKSFKTAYLEKTKLTKEKTFFIEKINIEHLNLKKEIEELERNLELTQDKLKNLVEIKESDVLNKTFEIEKLETNKIKLLESRVEKLKNEIKSKLDEKSNLEKEIIELENSLLLSKSNQNQNFAYILSKTLVEGEPCPCCGSKEHPHIVQDKNLDLESLEKEINSLEKNLNSKKIRIESLNLERIYEELENTNLELDGRTYDETLKKEKELKKELESLNDRLNHYKMEKDSLDKALEKLNSEKNIKKEKLSGILSKEELTAIELNKLDKEIKSLLLEFQNLEFSANDSVDFDKIDNFLKDISERELFLEEAETKLKNYNKIREKTLENFEKVNKEINEKSGEKNKLLGESYQLKNQVDENMKKLQELMVLNSFDSIEQLKNSVIKETQVKEFNDSIEKFNKLKIETLSKINSIKEKLGNDSSTLESLTKLKEEISELNKEFEFSINSLGQLAQNIEKMKKVMVEVKNLLEERGAEEKELNKFQELNKLFTGNLFVEYLALGRLRNIAYMASERLNKISNGHYALTTNEVGDFLIIDNFNNGETRRSATLSGGESFLVSLSLALALSSQIQLKSKSSLEFFFLDEGFGTLDSLLLDRVIGSLENLRDNEKMSIGLITHVEELKERVPRKLIVKAPVSGESGSLVFLE